MTAGISRTLLDRATGLDERGSLQLRASASILFGAAPYFIDYAATIWQIVDQTSFDKFEVALNKAFGSGSPEDTG
jgi:hypothetical protein